MSASLNTNIPIRGGGFLAFGEYDITNSPVPWTTGMSNLVELGGNWIAFTPYYTYYENLNYVSLQGTSNPVWVVNGNTINGSSEWYSDTHLIQLIQDAQAAGLKIMLKPMIDPYTSDSSGSWRAALDPGMSGIEAFMTTQYIPFITHYASIAEEYGVDLFCVGCELNTLISGPDGINVWPKPSSYTTYWIDSGGVIPSVRAIYSGPITYAGYPSDPAAIWENVDYLGVDIYPQLITSNYSTTDFTTLYAGAHGIANATSEYPASTIEMLAEFAGIFEKQIVLTETGFPNTPGSAYQASGIGVQAQAEQAAAVCAWVSALECGYEWYVGMFFWGWFTPYDLRNPTDGGFNQYGTLAADAVGRCWSEQRWLKYNQTRYRITV